MIERFVQSQRVRNEGLCDQTTPEREREREVLEAAEKGEEELEGGRVIGWRWYCCGHLVVSDSCGTY